MFDGVVVRTRNLDLTYKLDEILMNKDQLTFTWSIRRTSVSHSLAERKVIHYRSTNKTAFVCPSKRSATLYSLERVQAEQENDLKLINKAFGELNKTK